MRREALTAFFFLSSWATAAHRPGEAVSYTSDWPAEPPLDHGPTTPTVAWSVISVMLLILGIGAQR